MKTHFVVLFTTLLLLVVGCNEKASRHASPKTLTCQYRVTTSNYTEVTITYEKNGSTEQRTTSCGEGAGSWISDAFTVTSGEFVYISAQRTGDWGFGQITVQIYLNNKLAKEATSRGTYVIATTSGSV
jgi:hypothetical protein